jgi:lysyl-tRNA synthetase class 2
MTETNPLKEAREKKLALSHESGFPPWPARTGRTHRISEFHEQFEKLAHSGRALILAGRIRAIREHGGSAFLRLDDGSGAAQAYIKKDKAGEEPYKLFRDLADVGDFIEVSGIAFKTHKGEETLEVASWRPLAKALLPLPEKWHGLQDQEERFRHRYLDILSNSETRERFLKRAAFVSNIRAVLDREGFLEVETGMLEHVPSGAEAQPYRTRMNALDLDVFLRISLELPLKKLIIAGYEAVYEIGRVFRNEGMDQQHLPEGFTMLEFYAAYRDYRWLMDFVERFYAQIMERTFGTLKTPERAGTINPSRIYRANPEQGERVRVRPKTEGMTPERAAVRPKKERQRLMTPETSADIPALDFTPPWPRLEYKPLFKDSTGIDLDSVSSRGDLERAARAGGLEADFEAEPTKSGLMDALYKRYVRRRIIQPSFLIHHPAETNPLAKKKEDDPSVVERLQVVAAGAEIANAYSELNDPVEQLKRFKEHGGPIDEEFVQALHYGMPPTAGFGAGIDRLFMIMAGIENIRETIIFPLMRPK